eukprot:7651527-Pyramimonas_sp.AAC.1
MHHKIPRFARATRRYRISSKLAMQVGIPAVTYGHQVYGAFGTTMTIYRRRVGDAVGPRLPGRCLATLLDLRARNPLRKLPQDALRARLTTWIQGGPLQRTIQATWKGVVANFRSMPPYVRVRHIRGP